MRVWTVLLALCSCVAQPPADEPRSVVLSRQALSVAPPAPLVTAVGLVPTTSEKKGVRLAVNPSGLGLVVWLDDRAGVDGLYGARVDVQGVLLDPGGLLIARPTTTPTGANVAWHRDHFLVVWSSAGVVSEITMRRVAPDGALGVPVKAPAWLAVTGPPAVAAAPHALAGTPTALVAWGEATEVGMLGLLPDGGSRRMRYPSGPLLGATVRLAGADRFALGFVEVGSGTQAATLVEIKGTSGMKLGSGSASVIEQVSPAIGQFAFFAFQHRDVQGRSFVQFQSTEPSTLGGSVPASDPSAVAVGLDFAFAYLDDPDAPLMLGAVGPGGVFATSDLAQGPPLPQAQRMTSGPPSLAAAFADTATPMLQVAWAGAEAPGTPPTHVLWAQNSYPPAAVADGKDVALAALRLRRPDVCLHQREGLTGWGSEFRRNGEAEMSRFRVRDDARTVELFGDSLRSTQGITGPPRVACDGIDRWGAVYSAGWPLGRPRLAYFSTDGGVEDRLVFPGELAVGTEPSIAFVAGSAIVGFATPLGAVELLKCPLGASGPCAQFLPALRGVGITSVELASNGRVLAVAIGDAFGVRLAVDGVFVAAIADARQPTVAAAAAEGEFLLAFQVGRGLDAHLEIHAWAPGMQQTQLLRRVDEVAGRPRVGAKGLVVAEVGGEVVLFSHEGRAVIDEGEFPALAVDTESDVAVVTYQRFDEVLRNVRVFGAVVSLAPDPVDGGPGDGGQSTGDGGADDGGQPLPDSGSPAEIRFGTCGCRADDPVLGLAFAALALLLGRRSAARRGPRT